MKIFVCSAIMYYKLLACFVYKPVKIFLGPFNLSGEWSGALGNVVTGKYHFSPTNWAFTTERQKILSFIPAVRDRFECMLIPNSPDFDPGMLFRPFTRNVWFCILFLLTTAFCFATIPNYFIKDYENMTSNQIVSISFWGLFVLVNAFYGGALTMFFIAELSIPFNSLRDVLKAFPEWKLILLGSNKFVFIEEPALSVSIYTVNSVI